MNWALKSQEEFVCEICGSEMEVDDADGYWRETGGDNQKELFAMVFYCERKETMARSAGLSSCIEGAGGCEVLMVMSSWRSLVSQL